MSKSPRSPKSPRTGGWGEWKPSNELTVRQMQDLLGNKLPSSAKLRKDIVKVYDSERAKHGKVGGCGCGMKTEEETASGKGIRKGGCGCSMKHKEGEEEAYGKGSKKGGCMMDEDAFGKGSPRSPRSLPRSPNSTAKGLTRKTDLDKLIKQISTEYDFKDANITIHITIPMKTSMAERKEETEVHIGEFFEKSSKGDDGKISIDILSTSADFIEGIFKKIQPLLK